MSGDRADEDQRCHAQRNAASGLVYLLDDEIIARFDRTAGR